MKCNECGLDKASEGFYPRQSRCKECCKRRNVARRRMTGRTDKKKAAEKCLWCNAKITQRNAQYCCHACAMLAKTDAAKRTTCSCGNRTRNDRWCSVECKEQEREIVKASLKIWRQIRREEITFSRAIKSAVTKAKARQDLHVERIEPSWLQMIRQRINANRNRTAGKTRKPKSHKTIAAALYAAKTKFKRGGTGWTERIQNKLSSQHKRVKDKSLAVCYE